MKSFTRKSVSSQPAAETAVYLFDDWFDPIEAGVRDRVREFIQAMVEGELDAALMRPRYGRRSQSSSGDADGPVGVIGHRHGHRSRSLMGTFGRTEIEVPQARLDGPDGKTTEWKSKTLRAYQRRPLAADALIASTLAVEPDPHHGPVEDQPHDRLLGERAGVPGLPVGLHLPPHSAHRVLADRTAEQRRECSADPARVGPGEVTELSKAFRRNGLPTIRAAPWKSCEAEARQTSCSKRR